MKKLLSAVLTAIMICSLVVVATPGTASADSFTPLSGDVYYFTDNPNYTANVSYLVANTNYSYNQIHTICYNYNGNYSVNYEHALYDNLIDLFAETYHEDIYYSYVIFEWYDELVLGDLDSDNQISIYDELLKDDLFDDLTDFCSTLKQNGNYVMFISSTDQCRFYDDRDFLDYVDFHVDNDIYYTFISNMISRLEAQNGYYPLNSLNMVFGQSFIDYSYYGSNLMSSYFMRRYFEPYIVKNQTFYDYNYLEDVFTDGGINNSEAQIHLLFETSNGTYYDPYNNSTTYYNDVSINNGDWVFITASYYNDYETCARLNMMELFFDYRGMEEEIYYYNSYNYPLADLSEFTFHSARPAIYHTPSLQFLMKEYLLNADLESNYNNCTGECDITYKMLNTSPDGWMIINVSKECWQLVPYIPEEP